VALLLNAQGLFKSFGAVPLFQNIALRVSEGDRVGLVGPNGSGKSTLLEILAGQIEPDAGEVAVRKNTRLGYVAQHSDFKPGERVDEVMRRALERGAVPEAEQARRRGELLGRAGFTDLTVEASTLSGGWRKRLAIVEALVAAPDLLLLDEPTNHLDLAGINWLEKLIEEGAFACLVVSHDRYFLEDITTRMAELNRVYPEGLLQTDGNYSSFLERKSEFLAAQSRHQEALENRVRSELEWLRRGPKARATKTKARIDRAKELIGELNDLNARSRTATVGIDFSASDRKTKRLIELKGVSYGYGERTLFRPLDFSITAGMRLGLVGPNGSGKTTFLRLLCGDFEPLSGEVRRADSLQIVYFDQNRQLDPGLTLRQALAPHGDSVVYRGRTIHVASWAARFLFSNEQLNQPVSRLSGGERSRVLIARLMLEPADVLLLDEPTNDLDIPTIEILEESLIEFGGALVLITHDRFMLDRVSTLVLGLDGEGNAGRFADYSQWETWQDQRRSSPSVRDTRPTPESRSGMNGARLKKKLSYLDSRELETIEQRITEAEQAFVQKQVLLQDPLIARDPKSLSEAYNAVQEAQDTVDKLYARWAELEAKLAK
jgi:ABC transport system ATP-binding/permease protein